MNGGAISYLYACFPHLPEYLARFLPLRRLRARVDAARIAVYIRREPVALHIFDPRERLSPPFRTAQSRERGTNATRASYHHPEHGPQQCSTAGWNTFMELLYAIGQQRMRCVIHRLNLLRLHVGTGGSAAAVSQGRAEHHKCCTEVLWCTCEDVP